MSQVYNRQSLLKVSIELSELEFIMLASVLFISDVFTSGCRWILRINPTKKVKIAPRQLAIAFLVSIWKSPVKCVLQRITKISSMDSIKMIALSTDQKDLHTANIDLESETFISRRSHA